MQQQDLENLSFLERLDPANTKGLTARAGRPLESGCDVAGRDDVIAALQTVYDPELPVKVYDLGLIYRILINPKGAVAVMMTLTAPSCPVAGEIPKMVAEAVARTTGVGGVTVTLTWDPPWTRALMSEDARLAPGFDCQWWQWKARET